MTGSDDILREIAGHLGEQNDKLEFQHEQRQVHQRLQAAERAHLLVTLGVLSGLLTYYFREGGFGIVECFTTPSGPFCALITVSLFSVVLYIPGKLLTMTLQPVVDSELLNRINDVFLPAVNVFLVLGVVIASALYIIFPDLSHRHFTASYFLIAVLLSIVPAHLYTQKYQKIMGKIRTTSTRRNIIATSNLSGSDGFVRLTNPNSKPIPRDEITLRVDVPQNILVEIGHTIGNPNEDDEIHLDRELESNTVMDLPVTINPVTSSPKGEVEIEIDIPGQSVQTEIITYGVDDDHSGTTNIG